MSAALAGWPWPVPRGALSERRSAAPEWPEIDAPRGRSRPADDGDRDPGCITTGIGDRPSGQPSRRLAVHTANQTGCLDQESPGKSRKRPFQGVGAFTTPSTGGWHDSDRCRGLGQAAGARRSIDEEEVARALRRLLILPVALLVAVALAVPTTALAASTGTTGYTRRRRRLRRAERRRRKKRARRTKRPLPPKQRARRRRRPPRPRNQARCRSPALTCVGRSASACS